MSPAHERSRAGRGTTANVETGGTASRRALQLGYPPSGHGGLFGPVIRDLLIGAPDDACQVELPTRAAIVQTASTLYDSHTGRSLAALTTHGAASPVRRANRAFQAVLAAAAMSSVGDGIRTAALPLLALFISHSPLAVSGVALAGRLPWFVTAFLGGVIADRYDRRALMILVDSARGIAMAGLAALVLTGARSLLIVYGVAFLIGVGSTLFDLAAAAMLPEIVPQERLGRANGRVFTATLLGGDFAGPTHVKVTLGLLSAG